MQKVYFSSISQAVNLHRRSFCRAGKSTHAHLSDAMLATLMLSKCTKESRLADTFCPSQDPADFRFIGHGAPSSSSKFGSKHRVSSLPRLDSAAQQARTNPILCLHRWAASVCVCVWCSYRGPAQMPGCLHDTACELSIVTSKSANGNRELVQRIHVIHILAERIRCLHLLPAVHFLPVKQRLHLLSFFGLRFARLTCHASALGTRRLSSAAAKSPVGSMTSLAASDAIYQ